LGLALKLTWVPMGKVALQLLPQLMPEGVLVTSPAPVPAKVMFNVAAVRLKAAPTAALEFTVNAQEPVPVHAPDHPVNAEFVPAVAARVTWVPGLKVAVQVVPQLIPAGELVIVPRPLPESVIVSASGATLKAAPTDIFSLRVKVQELFPLQAPDHPANVELCAGLAVRVTCVPEENVALHVDPQLIPDGLLVMVPVPFPES
jgi:hypothetical protein